MPASDSLSSAKWRRGSGRGGGFSKPLSRRSAPLFGSLPARPSRGARENPLRRWSWCQVARPLRFRRDAPCVAGFTSWSVFWRFHFQQLALPVHQFVLVRVPIHREGNERRATGNQRRVDSEPLRLAIPMMFQALEPAFLFVGHACPARAKNVGQFVGRNGTSVIDGRAHGV